MREIRFRAWNKRIKKFVFDVVIENGGNIGQAYGHSSEGHGGIIGVKNYPNRKNIIIQLYTGLKDKNGKEIYEGDIFKYEGNDEKMTVEYDMEEYGCYGWNVDANETKEVIGNIYENPELLKNVS